MNFSSRNRVAVAFVLGILVLSSLAFLLLAPPAGLHPSTAPSPSGGVHSAAMYGHGDLTVLTGQTVVLSPGTTGSTIYYEAGNISVHSGGTLIVQNLTIDWVQFIGVTGTVAQRLANVFWFSDAGATSLSHSIITTDPNVLNAFAKLNVSVTGKLVVGSGSSLQFPGWVTVSGAGSLFLNSSTSLSNPQVGPQTLGPTVLADEGFSAALQAQGGGQIFIGNSLVGNYYADNYGANGVPGPTAVGNTSTETTSPYSWSSFAFVPPVAEGIAQAYAWENTPIVNGVLQVGYIENTPGGYTSGAGSTYTYASTPYGLGSLHFAYSPSGTILDVPLGGPAITAINAAGVPAFLQGTGAFGTASTQGVSFNFAQANVNVTSLTVILYPSFQYNITATGAGSRVTAVDSALGVNFNPVPGTPVAIGTPPPPPWLSQKILVSGGANAFVGNVTVAGAPFAPFNDSSAVIPSGASQAYFYQWLEVPITGGHNAIPVANGTTAAAYSGSDPVLAATVAGLNNLVASDPALGAYVAQSLAARSLLPSTSGGAGVAWSMLISTIVTSTLLPTGQFVGAYNVTVTVPPGAPGEVTHVAASLTPYPQVVSPGLPFTSPPAGFPGYQANLGVPVATSVVGVGANSTVAIGQILQVNVAIKNLGTAPTNNYTVTLTYPQVAGNVVVATSGLITKPISAGQNLVVPLKWLVNETVTGHQNKASFQVTFGVFAKWNGGLPDGGVNSTSLPITITPAFITLTWTSPFPSRLPTSANTLNTTGNATFAGKGTGTLTVLAVGQGGTFVLFTTSISNGVLFETELSAAAGMTMGATYTIELSANYNGRTYVGTFGTLTVAGTTTPPFFLFIQFLWFPIWEWLAIGGGIVAAVLLVTFGLGRFARGRLVECGECGNLIPEDATVCPKCGAEFETDLVRCSRCGSTIPSSSAVCPECAATLLARAGPENADPERQSYADFVERFRTEAKKELGQNYSEGAFWDWWKRQATYVSFSQWRLQQAQGTRTGMTAPVMTEEAPAPAPAQTPRRPPSGGVAPGAGAAAPAARPPAPRPAPAPRVVPAGPAYSAPTPPATTAAAPGGAGGGPGMKNCPNCGKQINADFLVCPFCGSVTG
ncbi:MAG: zinc ribbon domain-containing protein [Thermoplasmata archaeon]|nr:zinc ribbon domain-containing protein [Thermoplasmata archaeon]